MNLGKIGYYSKDDDYDKTFFYEGLGFTDITIDPHFDINNRKQVNEIIDSSYKHRIIGLPNDSCIVIKDNEIYYINNYSLYLNLCYLDGIHSIICMYIFVSEINRPL